ncbi:Fc.00g043510.m01.CDS01 [Cosmosporella sp. VM-42]
MAPFPPTSGLEWPKSLPRSLGTATIPDIPTVVRRQNAPATVTVISQRGGGANLSGGAIAGIVIGSVIGVLLILWIIRSCFNLGAPPQDREKFYRDAPPRRRHSHRSHSRRGSSISAPPPVFIQESRSRSRSQRPSATYVWTDKPRGRSGRRHHDGY